MKTLRLLLATSVLANVVLAALFFLRSASGSSSGGGNDAPSTTVGIAVSSRGTTETTASGADANIVLRDLLRAMGFPEDDVRAAVRARIEAPRLARQRELQQHAPRLPWWRVPRTSLDPSLDPILQNPELRELRKAERAELVRIFGPAADVTRAEVERYAFLPHQKAARLAALERDYRELRREVPTDASAPQTRAEIAEREKLITSEYERDLSALLSPDERAEVERHTSFAAYTVADRARYFRATEQEYDRLLELTKEHRKASNMDERKVPHDFQASIAASKKFTDELIALLGPERFHQWDRSSHDDYRALMELQRRFNPPQAVVDALAALPRQVGEEGMVIVRDNTKPEAQKVAEVRELAERTREKIRVMLGRDLGEAYNEAAARGWLDQLDRGFVPFFQENGQRAGFIVARGPLNMNGPPPRSASPQER